MTSRYSDYNNWAWLYNQTMGPDYSQPQLALLKRVLLPHIPAQGNILDLCCGTGQLIQPLIEAGYQVTGLDGSEDMLNYARQNAPQAAYCLEDARSFELSGFDGAFSTSASLNHLMSLEALTQVFDRVYCSLQDGGIFVFDLNHPQQLERWWQGHPTEGEINSNYAWMITPEYDSSVDEGAFRVTIFQPAAKQPGNSPLKRLLYKILSRPRFIGLRLRLIQNLAVFEPHWQRHDLTYPVKGHDLSQVEAALQHTGFEEISIQTIDGSSEIDTHHSAHFICTKPAFVQSSPSTTFTSSSTAS